MRRAAEYLELVTDKPKPRIGTGGWWLTVLAFGVVALVVVTVLGVLN